MACLMRICGSGPEALKGGAIVPYDYIKPSQRELAQAQQTKEQTKRRRKIPWVFSRKFHESYEIGDELGRGAFSIVYEATQIITTIESPSQSQSVAATAAATTATTTTSYATNSYAIKAVNRRNLIHKQLLDFTQEVSILSDLQHDNIIGLHELYKEKNHFYVVMEKLNGGELYDQLCARQCYTEMDARDVCRTVFEAIAYCHSQKVAHRDLKPENLLLKDAYGTDIKVADFGFAKRVESPNSLKTRCGTPAYTAPEIIKYKPYDERVDNWSLGVIVYTILGGYPPFYENTTRETFQRIVTAAFEFHSGFWDGISPDAKRLIRALLTIDPDVRITAAQVLEHPWMTGRGDDLQHKSLRSNLEQFKEYNEERKERNNVAAKANSVNMYWLMTRR